ncbi:hypothetical protein UT300003_32770 [Clostridium sardiniense]
MEKTVLDKESFLYGYMYRQAQELKEQGYFKVLSEKDIIGILLAHMKEEAR